MKIIIFLPNLFIESSKLTEYIFLTLAVMPSQLSLPCNEYQGECMKHCNALGLRRPANDCQEGEYCCVLTLQKLKLKSPPPSPSPVLKLFTATLLDLRATFPAAAAYLSKSHWTRGCLAITLDTLRNKNEPRGFELRWYELDTTFQLQYFRMDYFFIERTLNSQVFFCLNETFSNISLDLKRTVFGYFLSKSLEYFILGSGG